MEITGIVRPYSLSTYQNGYALIMEDFGGVSLQEYTSTNTIDLRLFLCIGIQLAEILDGLYRKRIIHKDIKPANILIHPETEQIKLIDFSIISLLPKETPVIQNPNVLEGTLAYLSPEQTGRMNRGIDYRADFYSLGVTFYELLTGKLPFEVDDAMELVHCHIAKYPPKINKIKPEIPLVISQIVEKLMAKNAEDRYQSALGLKYDLEKCLSQLKSTNKIDNFEIAQRDISDNFVISEKLYGREKEVETLLAAFNRVIGQEITSTNQQIAAKSEFMLVAGFSGVGKTAIVNEIHKPIVRQRGYFIKGKFDQFQRNIPLSAFVQAFSDLMGQLLSERDVKLAQWKSNILNELGENAQVIIELIPELEKIIGKQPPVPELSGTAAQNRFNLLFHKFLQVFTTKDHPLVIFIDDLQWADLASLKLMQLLLKELENGYLLLIGAYRDNEVFAAHPLMLTLDELKENNITINYINLEPLQENHINQIIANTLSCTLEIALPLTQLVYQKTKGNPFFTNQFLKALHDDKLITFNFELGYWECDITKVRAAALTDDIVKFMALQLQKLPAITQNILKLASCVGNQFDLNTLSVISQNSQTETSTFLCHALQEGIILPTSEIYTFFNSEFSQDKNQNLLTISATQSVPNVCYKFAHDRIQQAAYSLIPKNLKQATHLNIGQLILQSTAADKYDEKIFEIVNQLNIGKSLINKDSEREELAQLNLIAGRKAKSSMAYASAAEYLNTGIELLPEKSWENSYELTSTLYKQCAEVEYLNSNFTKSEELVNLILEKSQSEIERAQIYNLLIIQYTLTAEYAEAIQIGRKALACLNIDLPKTDFQPALEIELSDIEKNLGNRDITALVDAKNMEIPEKIVALEI